MFRRTSALHWLIDLRSRRAGHRYASHACPRAKRHWLD